MAGLFKFGAAGGRTVTPMLASLTHSTGMPALDAREDFARARRAQFAARAVRRLRGRRPNHPPTLPDTAAQPARARLEVIPLACVVGTVEPSPHFDERFRPASRHLRPRWERIALAHRRGVALPPVMVRRGPDGYYVADGRHRVSVALATGRRDIEAWVS
jgi:hypothetical protein